MGSNPDMLPSPLLLYCHSALYSAAKVTYRLSLKRSQHDTEHAFHKQASIENEISIDVEVSIMGNHTHPAQLQISPKCYYM